MYGGDEARSRPRLAALPAAPARSRRATSPAAARRVPAPSGASVPHAQVSAIVLDMGAETTKAGYAGEDTPKGVFPTSVGLAPPEAEQPKKYYVDDFACVRQNMEVASPFTDGLVTDWDAFLAVWDYALQAKLRVQSEGMEHPLMIAEPAFNTKALREKLVQHIFDKYSPPALFLAKARPRGPPRPRFHAYAAGGGLLRGRGLGPPPPPPPPRRQAPVLSSFSAGRPTSLVIDIGHAGTVVTPVHDGYALVKGITRSPLAGAMLTDITLRHVRQLAPQQPPPSAGAAAAAG